MRKYHIIFILILLKLNHSGCDTPVKTHEVRQFIVYSKKSGSTADYFFSFVNDSIYYLSGKSQFSRDFSKKYIKDYTKEIRQQGEAIVISESEVNSLKIDSVLYLKHFCNKTIAWLYSKDKVEANIYDCDSLTIDTALFKINKQKLFYFKVFVLYHIKKQNLSPIILDPDDKMPKLFGDCILFKVGNHWETRYLSHEGLDYEMFLAFIPVDRT